MKKYITIGTITLLVILTILSFSDDPSVNEKYLNYMTVVGIIIILSIIIKSFINRQEEYDQNHQLHDPKLDELRSSLMPMFDGSVKYNGVLDHLNGRKVLEEIELYRGDKSYTINKKKIYLCLYDENEEYYPDQMVIFVLLHELGHVLCKEVGHTNLFNDIFDALLEKAAELGVYDPKFPIILDYCLYKKD